MSLSEIKEKIEDMMKEGMLILHGKDREWLKMRLDESLELVKQPVLRIMIGPAGSGKTTLRKCYPKCVVVSKDEIRFNLLNYPASGIDFDPKIEPDVMKKTIEIFDQLLDQRKDILFDATNPKISGRMEFVVKALRKNYSISYVYFNLSLMEILRRNRNRSRIVSEKVIANQYSQLEKPENWEYDIITYIEDPENDIIS